MAIVKVLPTAHELSCCQSVGRKTRFSLCILEQLPESTDAFASAGPSRPLCVNIPLFGGDHSNFPSTECSSSLFGVAAGGGNRNDWPPRLYSFIFRS